MCVSFCPIVATVCSQLFFLNPSPANVINIAGNHCIFVICDQFMVPLESPVADAPAEYSNTKRTYYP